MKIAQREGGQYSQRNILSTASLPHPHEATNELQHSQSREREVCLAASQRKTMAISMSSSLTSSFASISLSSKISQKPHHHTLSFSQHPTNPPTRLVVRASSATLETPIAPELNSDLESVDIEKYVKSRLPGGFAAQPIYGTGRRKCAIARVVLQEGTGKVIINYRDARDYLQGNPLWIQYCTIPLVALGYETTYDVFVKAHGGGLSGQSQAISLGVARALLRISEIHRKPLRQEGLLTRDSRVVERKKVGLKKARKAPQFSKR